MRGGLARTAALGALVAAGLLLAPGSGLADGPQEQESLTVRAAVAEVKLLPPTPRRPFGWLVVQVQIDNQLPVEVRDLLVRLDVTARSGVPVSRQRHLRGRVGVSAVGRLELAQRVPGAWASGPLPHVKVQLIDYGVGGELTARQLARLASGSAADRGVAIRLARRAPGTLALAALRGEPTAGLLTQARLTTPLRLAEALHSGLESGLPEALAEAGRLTLALADRPAAETAPALLGLAARGSVAARDALGRQPTQAGLLAAALASPRAAMRQVAHHCLSTLASGDLDAQVAVTSALLARWPDLPTPGDPGPTATHVLLRARQLADAERAAQVAGFLARAASANRESLPRVALAELDALAHQFPEDVGAPSADLRAAALAALLDRGADDDALAALRQISLAEDREGALFRPLHTAAHRQRAARALREGQLEVAHQHLQLALIHGDPDQLRRLQVDLAAAQVDLALVTGDRFLAHQALGRLEKLDGSTHQRLARRLFWASYGSLIALGAGVLLMVLLACMASFYQRLMILERLLGTDAADAGPAVAHPYR